MWCDTSSRQERRLTARCCAHSCRLCAFVIIRVIVDGVLGVTVVVLIGHDVYMYSFRSHFRSQFSVTGDVLFTPPVGDSELR